MRRRLRSNDNPRKHTLTGRPFTAADVRLMLSSPVYAYGINLQPTEHVAAEVMKLITLTCPGRAGDWHHVHA